MSYLILPVRCSDMKMDEKGLSGWDVLWMCASVSGMVFMLLLSEVDSYGPWDIYTVQSLGLEG